MNGNRLFSKSLANLAALAVTLLGTEAHAAPQSSFVYEGRLFDNANAPINNPSVNFKLSIYDPAGSCLLYEETQTANLQSSNPLDQGVFSLRVGSGTRTANDSALFLHNIFSGSAALTGYSSCIYTPTPFDSLHLRVTVDTGSGFETLSPDYIIDASPGAIAAQSLQGKSAADFLAVSPNATQANIESLVGLGDVGTLHNHDGRYDSRYVRLGSASVQNLGSGTIVTTGSLGVGTASPSPSSNLHVVSGSASAVVMVEGTAGAGGQLQLRAGGATQATLKTDAANDFTIETGGSAALVLKNDHNAFFSANLFTAGFVRPGSGVTNATEAAFVAGLVTCGVSCDGAIFYNTDLNALRIWDLASGVRSMASSDTAPTDGQVLKWDNAAQEWVPWTVVASDATKLALDGSVAMTGNLDLGAHSLTNVVNLTATGTLTAANLTASAAVTGASLAISGGAAASALSVGTLTISAGGSAATLSVASLTISAGKITAAPSVGTDLVNKTYADANLVGKTLATPSTAEAGQAIRWNNSTLQWEYFVPVTGAVVTSITAGTGLANSGSGPSPILNVSYGTSAGTALQGDQSFSGDVSGTATSLAVTGIQSQPVSAMAPGDGQVLMYEVGAGSVWKPKTLPTASASITGVLSSSDWTTFNGKQDSLGFTPVNKAGDAMTGDLTLNADPTVALGAATKQYVDSVSSTAGATYLRKDGSAPLSGNWNIGGSYRITNVPVPTGDGDAANKGYVDSTIADNLGSLTPAQIPALDAAKITTGTFQVSRGGTGSSSFSGNQLIVANVNGDALQSFTSCSSGDFLSFSAGSPGCASINQSQWTTNGSDIHYSSGNVGIGTASPSAKLQIEGGDAKINGLTVGRGANSLAYNTAIGLSALSSVGTADFNTAVGSYALQLNNSGNDNAAVGANALRSNFSGSGNSALGSESLYSNTFGQQNTAVGSDALYLSDTGNYNTAVGSLALYSVATTSYNTAIGFSALAGSSGVRNIGIGANAGDQLYAGDYNVIIGSNNGSAISGQSNTILISDGAGTERLRVNGSGNVGIGTTPTGTDKLSVNGPIRANGAIYSPSITVSTGATLDFSQSNTINYTGGSCSSLTFSNMVDGGKYDLIVTNTGTGACNFSTSGGDTFRFNPGNGSRIGSTHTIYSFFKVGTIIYVQWQSGF